MTRSTRNKSKVNYTETFGAALGSDEDDFSTVRPSTSSSKSKKQGTKGQSTGEDVQSLRDVSNQKPNSKRTRLPPEERQFERDLKVALQESEQVCGELGTASLQLVVAPGGGGGEEKEGEEVEKEEGAVDCDTSDGDEYVDDNSDTDDDDCPLDDDDDDEYADSKPPPKKKRTTKSPSGSKTISKGNAAKPPSKVAPTKLTNTRPKTAPSSRGKKTNTAAPSPSPRLAALSKPSSGGLGGVKLSSPGGLGGVKLPSPGGLGGVKLSSPGRLGGVKLSSPGGLGGVKLPSPGGLGGVKLSPLAGPTSFRVGLSRNVRVTPLHHRVNPQH